MLLLAIKLVHSWKNQVITVRADQVVPTVQYFLLLTLFVSDIKETCCVILKKMSAREKSLKEEVLLSQVIV